jgi:hypothetical protein
MAGFTLSGPSGLSHALHYRADFEQPNSSSPPSNALPSHPTNTPQPIHQNNIKRYAFHDANSV